MIRKKQRVRTPGRLARTRRTLRDGVGLVWAASPREFAFIGALQIIAGVSGGASVFVVQHVVTSAASGGGFKAVIPPFAAMAAISLALAALQTLQTERKRVLSELVIRRAIDRVLEVATSVDLLAFDDPEFHDRLRRAQMHGQFRSLQLADGVTGVAGTAAGSLGLLAALTYLQPLLLPVVLLGYVPLWLLSAKNSRDLYNFNYETTTDDRERAYLQQLLTTRPPAKEVRAFNLAAPLRVRHDRIYDRRIAMLRALARQRTQRAILGSLASTGGLALALGVIGGLYIGNALTAAAAVSAVYALLQFTNGLQGLFAAVSALYEGLLFVRDYDWFVGFETSARDVALPAPKAFSSIVADRISFWYPDALQPALCDVSVEFRAGEVIALVGENGSGKTTLAKLLAGLFTPTTGRILWDGVDVSAVDREQLRECVAVIFQDFEQYRLSAHENIGFGRHTRLQHRDEIVEAATEADAHRFLSGLPNAYDTLLGREFGGSDLSVGQWQRVALARAIFRAAPLIILDEPTSAMDPRAESELFSRMRAMMRDRTVVLISHRFSSVRAADRIYVLDNGSIVEQGSHEELMHERGLYAELFTLQAAAYLERDSNPTTNAPSVVGLSTSAK